MNSRDVLSVFLCLFLFPGLALAKNKDPYYGEQCGLSDEESLKIAEKEIQPKIMLLQSVKAKALLGALEKVLFSDPDVQKVVTEKTREIIERAQKVFDKFGKDTFYEPRQMEVVEGVGPDKALWPDTPGSGEALKKAKDPYKYRRDFAMDFEREIKALVEEEPLKKVFSAYSNAEEYPLVRVVMPEMTKAEDCNEIGRRYKDMDYVERGKNYIRHCALMFGPTMEVCVLKKSFTVEREDGKYKFLDVPVCESLPLFGDINGRTDSSTLDLKESHNNQPLFCVIERRKAAKQSGRFSYKDARQQVESKKKEPKKNNKQAK